LRGVAFCDKSVGPVAASDGGEGAAAVVVAFAVGDADCGCDGREGEEGGASWLFLKALYMKMCKFILPNWIY